MCFTFLNWLKVYKINGMEELRELKVNSEKATISFQRFYNESK